ncbi:MAG: ubiquitin-like protein Pup [Acidothermales bacterium]|jgi:ubiquitin-like protein Pup|nr:ubiquitin-like protein Pup [Acidothermales bacterium]
MATKEPGGQQRTSKRDQDVEAVEIETRGAEDVQERHDALSEDVDSILDEIDEVLESNAEEFVRSFIQKGGE